MCLLYHSRKRSNSRKNDDTDEVVDDDADDKSDEINDEKERKVSLINTIIFKTNFFSP